MNNYNLKYYFMGASNLIHTGIKMITEDGRSVKAEQILS